MERSAYHERKRETERGGTRQRENVKRENKKQEIERRGKQIESMREREGERERR